MSGISGEQFNDLADDRASDKIATGDALFAAYNTGVVEFLQDTQPEEIKMQENESVAVEWKDEKTYRSKKQVDKLKGDNPSVNKYTILFNCDRGIRASPPVVAIATF